MRHSRWREPAARGERHRSRVFAELSDSERIVGNLHRAYAELKGTPAGGAIDVVAALGDMVTFNGGHPLTCRA